MSQILTIHRILEGINHQKTATNEEKSALSPRQCTVSQVNRYDGKLHELLPHLPYSPDQGPRYYWLFADLKRMLQRKRFGSNEEVISETEPYFEAKDKLLYKKGIDLLEKR